MKINKIIWNSMMLLALSCSSIFMACSDDTLENTPQGGDGEEQIDGSEEEELPDIDVSNMTLKEAIGDKFLIGAAVQAKHINPPADDDTFIRENEVFKKHFNALVCEGDMKWRNLIANYDMNKKDNDITQYDFSRADQYVKFAEENNMTVTGHCLVWHTTLPNEVWQNPNGSDKTKEEVDANMKYHINTVLSHFKGKIKGWDVVNEAFNSDGTFRSTPFYRIMGEDYIIKAFKYAHEADPDIELYYNDFELYYTPKRQAVLKLIGDLRKEGIEISVGLQAHMWMENPTVEIYENLIRSLRDAGVKVMITEWDISVVAGKDLYPNGLPIDVNDTWTKRVLDFFRLFLKYKDTITRVTTWGVSDSHSWKNQDDNGKPIKDYCLLFDREQNPKPVVEMMMKVAAAEQ